MRRKRKNKLIQSVIILQGDEVSLVLYPFSVF
jgi:hypothetical protein